MRDAEGRALSAALTGLFSQPFHHPLADEAFNAAALRVFAFQYARNVAYAAYCDRRDRSPDTVHHWTMIPAVPTAAFREVPLVAGDAAAAEAVFRTSGTTRGPERRGTHYVADLSLYDASLVPNFAACVLPDHTRPRMLSLVPSSHDAPDSSLSYMVDTVMQRLGTVDSMHCATLEYGIDEDRLAAALYAAEESGTPVCLIGTSFAFVHWLDALDSRSEQFRLPAGSRLMDTGGYKGRSRVVDAAVLRGMYHDLLGIPDSHCVNEYGMTEMCSQFYDAALLDSMRGITDDGTLRRKVVPPWVRTRIVDPETLEPVGPGQHGLLQHFDLANAHSVMAIQTDDIGVATNDGFRLLGRAEGAAPRGCSIAMDILLEAMRDRHD